MLLVIFSKNSPLSYSLDYEECAHKMMKMNLKPGQEVCFHLVIFWSIRKADFSIDYFDCYYFYYFVEKCSLVALA